VKQLEIEAVRNRGC